MEEFTITQMQNMVSEMLKATIDICEKNKITYYAQAGTVLGTIRHSGTIPWDHDADIIVPNNEIDKFVECCQNELPDKFYVDYYKVNDSTLRQFPRIGKKGFSTDVLHLDVFRLIGLPDNADEQTAMIEEAHYYTKMNALMRKPLWKIAGKSEFLTAWRKLTNRCYYIEKFDELCNRYPYARAKYVMNPSGKYGKKNIFEKTVYGKGILMKYENFQINVPSETDLYLKQYYGDYMKFPPENETSKEMGRMYLVR